MSLNIELKYSEKGIPYINLDKYGTLIFSQLTATENWAKIRKGSLQSNITCF
jgi:hypothetical protein